MKITFRDVYGTVVTIGGFAFCAYLLLGTALGW